MYEATIIGSRCLQDMCPHITSELFPVMVRGGAQSEQNLGLVDYL